MSPTTNPEKEIPSKCQVLIIGGGPGGSYAAAVLSREGLDVVLLEADIFPRYHIGESMLASMRHFLRFVDLDETFNEYGFTKKVGAAFKLIGQKREGFTDFIATGGPENYAWNVVRSESDELMFRHAGKCGARVFDGVKVVEIAFAPLSSYSNGQSQDMSANGSSSVGETPAQRPVSASWVRKSDKGAVNGTGADKGSGTITFDYLIDASGRAGLLSTRYLKTRTYNQGLRNVANWGYWRNAGSYAPGTNRANSPFFEALIDESGWAWLIPLHNGTTSVGIVMNQGITTEKKKAVSPAPSIREFYLEQLKLAPNLLSILHSGFQDGSNSSPMNGNTTTTSHEGNDENNAEPASLITSIHSASDYSYNSSTYSTPFSRIIGDAGCFIDPYFSSGVHLALTSALSAAATILASLRGDCSEAEAGQWHDKKVGVGYTRFLMVVLSAYRQIRRQGEAVLADFGEDNFDRAFGHFRPIIQGTADVGKLSQEELSKTLEFCAQAFEPSTPEERARILEKLKFEDISLSSPPVPAPAGNDSCDDTYRDVNDSGIEIEIGPDLAAKTKPKTKTDLELDVNLNEEEQRVLNHIRARKMMRTEDILHIESFSTDVIDGFAVRLERGRLGLLRVGQAEGVRVRE